MWLYYNIKKDPFIRAFAEIYNIEIPNFDKKI
jgi:hypothetical protein